MKTKITILVLTFYLTSFISAFAQNALYFQGFENATCPSSDNWDYVGGNVNTELAKTGSHSARVGRSGESNTLTFNPANVSGYNNLVLSISHSVRIGSAVAMDTREAALIFVRVDGGAWIWLGSVAGNSDYGYSWTTSPGGSPTGTTTSGTACTIFQMPNPITYPIPGGASTVEAKVISYKGGSACSSFNNAMASPTTIAASNYDRVDEGFFVDNVTISTSSAVPVMPGCPLPISLLSFSGDYEDGKGELYWSTASEENNRGFEIEKSIDGIHYTKIGFVEGNGNSSTILHYMFEDAQLTAGSYYRLKQIDYDGKFSYSNVILINTDSANETISLYPVPAMDNFTVSMYSKISDKVTIEVTDLVSQTVLSSVSPIQKGENMIVTDLQNLSNGAYFVTITTSSGRREVKRIQVIR